MRQHAIPYSDELEVKLSGAQLTATVWNLLGMAIAVALTATLINYVNVRLDVAKADAVTASRQADAARAEAEAHLGEVKLKQTVCEGGMQ